MTHSIRQLAAKSLAMVTIVAASIVATTPAALAQTSAATGASQTPASQPADKALATKIREAVGKWTSGRYKVQDVRTTPIKGLYEIRIQNDLFFVDEAARYILIEGEMVDIANSRNLTRERMQEVMAIKFDDLPLDKAIKQVNGDGSRVVALFEDPNCSYCRRLRGDLMNIDNLTVYTFVYPILAADSDLKSRQALCSPDPSEAWNDLMLKGVVPKNDGSCKNAVADIKALGESYGIQATPTMFFPSGMRVQGYAPPTRFVEVLEKNQSAPAS